MGDPDDGWGSFSVYGGLNIARTSAGHKAKKEPEGVALYTKSDEAKRGRNHAADWQRFVA